MANTEIVSKRKSQPLKEPVLDDEAHKKRERFLLATYGIGIVVVILGMLVLSRFLSKGPGWTPLVYSFLAGVGLLGLLIVVNVIWAKKM